MKKHVTLIAIALVLCMLFAACGNSAPASVKEEKILTVQVGPNPETLDPALNSAVDGGNMLLHLDECLLTVDKDGNIAPGVAETWESSEDGLTWTFHLRDGLKWSDGSDFKASDFVFSWQRVANPETAAPYADTVLWPVVNFNDVFDGSKDPSELGVSAPDDKTFVVELSSACPYFESLAAFATLSPVNPATVEKNGDAWAVSAETYVSNGPFMISEWVPGSYILTKANPNYWNKDAIKLDGIKWLLIEDSNASYSAYQTGEALFIKDVPTEEIPSLMDNAEFHIDPILGTYYLNLNCSKAPFDNVLVRKALNLAIDRNYIANTIMQGTYSPAYNFVGPGVSDATGYFFDNAVKANGNATYISKDYEANKAAAKQALADAGYPNGQGFPTITYSTNDSGYHVAVAEYLQQCYKDVLGINMVIEKVEWSSFTPQRREGNYEMARNGWVMDYNDASNMIELLYSTNGNNDGKYNNPAFDAAIDASKVADSAAHFQALHNAEKIMMEDYANIPVAYYTDFWLQSSTLKGVWHSPYGYWYLQYAYIG